MTGRKFIFFTLPCVVILGISTYGTGCKTSRDCLPLEICDRSMCQCSQGHVRYMGRCFPVRAYGEECLHDFQCSDDRLICINEDHDVKQKTFCFCDLYYIWNSTVKECLEINITQTAGNFREVHKIGDMIERSSQKVFLGVVITGLIIVCILLSFIGVCSIYGCCTKRRKRRYGKNDSNKDQKNEVAITGLPGSYEAIDTDFSTAI